MRSNRQSCLQISSLFQVTLSLTSVLLNPSGKKAGAGRPPLWVSLFPPCIQNSGQHPAHAPRRPPALPARNRSISAILESRVSFILISILTMINARSVPPAPFGLIPRWKCSIPSRPYRIGQGSTESIYRISCTILSPISLLHHLTNQPSFSYRVQNYETC